MGGYSDLTIWTVIVVLGIGTYLMRWSFLGAVGNRPLPEWAQRLLRYTAVAVLPALVAPQVIWPAATQGHPDPARLLAAAVTVAAGLLTRHTLWAILAGGAALALGMGLMG
ncbi:AzlD domain-containing protein [Paracoccus contaminans]|uniref:AzlD domain-containing protein n=1 Tax=Paracoccus contaminans TaxID=1945662 RepID=A0A1W6CX87_9RHOB|nr:AzlD domain-containing protein [Paracoccus contaminans]ARJ69471.1 hypothetical protein B0A89_07365 [Paracoccus contaminans]